MTDATHVDGNALGGLLIDVFGREMTDAHGCCASEGGRPHRQRYERGPHRRAHGPAHRRAQERDSSRDADSDAEKAEQRFPGDHEGPRSIHRETGRLASLSALATERRRVRFTPVAASERRALRVRKRTTILSVVLWTVPLARLKNSCKHAHIFG